MWGDIGEIYARDIAALTVVHEVPRLRDVAPAVAHLAREDLLVRAHLAEVLVRILEKIRHPLTDRHIAKLAADITRVFAPVASAVFVESFAATWFSAHAVLALGANSS